MKTLFLCFFLLISSFSLTQETLYNEEWHSKLESDLEFICFPNPAKSILSIRVYRGEYKDCFVKIYDSFGKTFINKDFYEKEDLDITALPKGSYIVEIYNEKSISRERIILQ